MRLGSVIVVMIVGLGLGTAAVIMPLSGGVAIQPSSWIANWQIPALKELAAYSNAARSPTVLGEKSDSTTPIANATRLDNTAGHGKVTAGMAPTVVPAETSGIFKQLATSNSKTQDNKTIEYLSQSGANTAKAADARVVETPWTTQVIVASDASQRKPTSSKPSNEDQRRELVRQIQIELKRVGCYDGATDGQWGGASRRAMGNFTESVNASLPYDEPDLILLTLVRGQRGTTCGDNCPSGQTPNDAGRCTPSSIIARSERPRLMEQAHESINTAQATNTRADRTDPTSNSRSVDAARATRGSIESAWATTTVKTPVEMSSVAALVPPPQRKSAGFQQQPAPIAVATDLDAAVRTTAPLPGRMAMGAPLPPSTAAEPDHTSATSSPSAKPSAEALPHARTKNSGATSSSAVHKSAARPRAQQFSAAQRPAKPQQYKPFWWW